MIKSQLSGRLVRDLRTLHATISRRCTSFARIRASSSSPRRVCDDLRLPAMLGQAFALAAPLLGSLASASAAATPGVAPESLDVLARRCQFTLGNRRFDLCPVFDGKAEGWTVVSERPTPPTVTKVEYRISFAGPLKASQWTPRDEQVRQKWCFRMEETCVPRSVAEATASRCPSIVQLPSDGGGGWKRMQCPPSRAPQLTGCRD